MSSHADSTPELVMLLLAAADRNLSREESQRLRWLVMHDPEAQDAYLDQISLISNLRWLSVSAALPLSNSQTTSSSDALPADISSIGQEQTTNHRKVWPSIVAPLSRLRHFSSGRRLYYVAAVAICLYGSFVLVAWNLRPDKLNGYDQPVAVVRDTTDVQWAKNASSKSAESSILSGEPLKIDSGTIEFELNAGAKLVVEGPADWSVDGRNSVSLRAGKLIACVPEQAIGFTVETPTAKIVDLGTEFGVEVGRSGTTDVQVLNGKIEVMPGQKVGAVSQAAGAITLSAGEARKIEFAGNKSGLVVRKIAASPNRFVRRSDDSSVRQIAVSGALASSTYSSTGLSVNYLTNGSGMHGDSHTCQPGDGAMWHTDIGKVKDEYVLFDLGLPCRLSLMKVWNYNDSFDDYHRWRGVKQADIYISTSGRGTPLDHREEWTLIAEDVQFEPGSGTSEYNTPKQIPLNNVTARFVAMVIDEAHGHDLRGFHPDQSFGDVVGLSEVQFFGVRAKPAKKDSH